MKDIIYIKDLRVKTIIGIFDWERKVKQEVSIDLEFPFDCKKAAKTIRLRIPLITKLFVKASLSLLRNRPFNYKNHLLRESRRL